MYYVLPFIKILGCDAAVAQGLKRATVKDDGFGFDSHLGEPTQYLKNSAERAERKWLNREQSDLTLDSQFPLHTLRAESNGKLIKTILNRMSNR